MRRFLIIQLRAIGDVVLATGLAHVIKEQVPDAWVGFMTEPPSHTLLEHNPHIDEIFVHHRKDKLLNELRLARRLRKQRLDVVIDAICNPTSAQFAFASGARRRVGFRTTHRNILFTDVIPRSSGYSLEDKKALLSVVGIESGWNCPEVFLTPEEKAWARAKREELLSRLGGHRFFTIDPTHKHAYRLWNFEQYGRLCQMLKERYGAVGAILRGPEKREDEAAGQVQGHSGGTAEVSPPTSLRQAAALTEAADFHIGNCSAPRHIAVAVGTPSFTISGTSQSSWRHPAPQHQDDPYTPDCGNCEDPCRERKDLRCMAERTAEEMWPALEKWFEGYVAAEGSGDAAARAAKP